MVLAASAATTVAAMATVTAMTSAVSAATTTTTSTTASTRTTAASSAIAATVAASVATTISRGGRIDAVEVRLVAFLELGTAFERQRRSACRNRLRFRLGFSLDRGSRRRSAAAHFRALLFENRFARKTNAVAFDGEHFHQDLIAFLQLVANIFNAMLCDFADVQQTFGSRDDFDECSEISQTRDFAEIGLPYFGGRGQVANDLNGLVSRRFVVRSDV